MSASLLVGMQVAIDFFPPESAAVVMGLADYRRQFALRLKNDEEKDVGDTLQGQATMMYACHHAYKIKTGQLKKFPVVDKRHKRSDCTDLQQLSDQLF